MSVRALRRGTMAGRGAATDPPNVSYLSLPGTNGNFVSTPDSEANSITGDIDIRAKIAPVDWTPGLQDYVISKWGSTTGWGFERRPDGPLRLRGYNTGTVTGTASSVAPGFTDGSAHWVRATRAAATGSINYYTSEDYDPDAGTGTWTPLGTTVSSTAGSFSDAPNTLVIGTSSSLGNGGMLNAKVYYVEIRNGIDGTVAASFDATAVTKIGTRNPTTYTAPTGEVWTVNGSAWDWATV